MVNVAANHVCSMFPDTTQDCTVGDSRQSHDKALQYHLAKLVSGEKWHGQQTGTADKTQYH